MEQESLPKISIVAVRVNANLSRIDAAKKFKEKGLDLSVNKLENYETGRTKVPWSFVLLAEEIYGYPKDFVNWQKIL